MDACEVSVVIPTLIRPRPAGLALMLALALAVGGCSATPERSAEQAQADGETAARVFTALKDNKLYLYPALYVRVRNGEVYLSGLAAGGPAFDAATSIARGIPGVTSVTNAMQVDAGRF